MAYDGRAVANFILDECNLRNRPITNLSLQKITFFCHAWSLIILHKPLIKHKFEAWQHGPVLQYLYHEFKHFEDKAISTRAKKINLNTGAKELVEYSFDQDTTSLLHRVVDFYSRINAYDLVDLSHAKGGPWDLVWNHQGKINPGMFIDDADIVRFYSRVPEPAVLQ